MGISVIFVGYFSFFAFHFLPSSSSFHYYFFFRSLCININTQLFIFTFVPTTHYRWRHTLGWMYSICMRHITNYVQFIHRYICCDTAAKCWRRRNPNSLVPAATAAATFISLLARSMLAKASGIILLFKPFGIAIFQIRVFAHMFMYVCSCMRMKVRCMVRCGSTNPCLHVNYCWYHQHLIYSMHIFTRQHWCVCMYECMYTMHGVCIMYMYKAICLAVSHMPSIVRIIVRIRTETTRTTSSCVRIFSMPTSMTVQ